MLTPDYKPRVGGLATATFELAKALASVPGVELKLVAPISKTPKEDQIVDGQSSFQVVRIPSSGSGLLAWVKWAFLLRALQKEWRPDVFLNMLWLPCSLAVWVGISVGLLRTLPYFTIVHGVEVVESTRTLKKRLRRYGRWIKTRVLQRSAAIFSVSEFTRQVLIKECGVPGEKIKVVYNGIDSLRFFPRLPSPQLRREWGAEDRFVFLTVSRLEDYKGIDQVLRALRKLSQEHPSILYLIGGEGPDQSRLESLVDEYHLQKNVHFLGRVADQDLSEFFNLCDVFILMAREDWLAPNFEGFGIVLLEAGACGKPCIAGKSGGVPEVVLEQETGWIVPPEDEDAIYRTLLAAIENEELRVQFGQAARERAVREFTWQRSADQVLKEMRLHVRN